MTSTNQPKTLQSAMSQLRHLRDGNAMSEGFNVTIEHPISVSEAVEITGYSRTQIRRFCQEYHDTQGKSGLKSAKFGKGKTIPWYIEKSALEEFYKTNADETKT